MVPGSLIVKPILVGIVLKRRGKVQPTRSVARLSVKSSQPLALAVGIIKHVTSIRWLNMAIKDTAYTMKSEKNHKSNALCLYNLGFI